MSVNSHIRSAEVMFSKPYTLGISRNVQHLNFKLVFRLYFGFHTYCQNRSPLTFCFFFLCGGWRQGLVILILFIILNCEDDGSLRYCKEDVVLTSILHLTNSFWHWVDAILLVVLNPHRECYFSILDQYVLLWYKWRGCTFKFPSGLLGLVDSTIKFIKG